MIVDKVSKNTIFILGFILSVILLHNKSYNEIPSKTHGWAQSDHYALALGFLENDFDFLHPKTFSLTHQFPPKKKLKNPKGITATDFPILHFSVALVMKVLNTTDPWVFRFIMLLLSFIALFFLFKTIKKIKGFWFAIFIVGFIMFQPIYAYYQNGFHVSMAAYNILLIGFVYLLKYFYYSKEKYFYLGLFFLVLAGLMRFTQVIFLIALGGALFINIIKTKKFDLKIIFIGIGLLIIGSYFYYNKLLAESYGTIFLNKPMITTDLHSFIRQILRQFKMYIRGFLPLTHLVGLGIILYTFRKYKTKINSIIKYWFLFSLLGVIIFNLLMSWSCSVHDYYSLDTWLPLITLGLMLIVISTNFKPQTITSKLLIILFLTGTVSVAMEIQHTIYKYKFTTSDQLAIDFKNSLRFLNNYNFNNKKTMVITPPGWNTPMISWHHDVYRIANKFNEQIPKIYNNDFDYIITQDRTFNEIVIKNSPDFKSKVKKIASNGLVTIWKPLKP